MKALKHFVWMLVCLVASAPLVSAQGKVPDFIETRTITIKPTAVSEFEDYVKKVVAGANKLGAPQRWLTYQLASGGPQFTYLVAFPFNKWEEMDRWTPTAEILTKGYGELEGTKLLKGGRACIEDYQITVSRTLHDLSTRAKPNDPPAAFVYNIRTEVDPDMSSAYELYLAKVKAAAEQAPNAPTAIRRVSVQGTSNVYSSSTYFNKHAERDGWPNGGELLRKAYGEAEARNLTETSLRAVRKREYRVLAFRADLSRPTAAPAPTN